MKLLSHLPKDKAQKELRQFAILGLIFSIITLFIFGWLGAVGLAFSARALVLAKHDANKTNPQLNQYRWFAYSGLILSIFGFGLFLLKN